METKTHWKKLVNPNYIGAYSMPTDGSDIVLTIKNVVREIVTGEGGKKEECTVAYFTQNSKPMILNRTNCKSISKVHGSSYIEDWQGKNIQIYVAKVKVAGDVVDALRIREFEPQLTSPKTDAELSFLKTIEADISGIENKEDLKAYWDDLLSKNPNVSKNQEAKALITKRKIELQ